MYLEEEALFLLPFFWGIRRMKKYFIGLKWLDEITPVLHLRDFETSTDEYVKMPVVFDLEKKNQKICIGTINPYTRQYVRCNNPVEDNQKQCNLCKYMYDFYKCVKCHGDNCYAKDDDVLKYCNTPHYVYLAYFNGDKIKVGTASEVKKHERLLEQGALFSILIAKTPTGRIARSLEKIIIDSGVSGLVTTNYKMRNIAQQGNDENTILKKLLDNYREILNSIPSLYHKFLIEPEYNSYAVLEKKIENTMFSENYQLDLFNSASFNVKPYIIKKKIDNITGKYLFVVGKVLALENKNAIDLIDIKQMEGWLFDFKDMSLYDCFDERKDSGK